VGGRSGFGLADNGTLFQPCQCCYFYGGKNVKFLVTVVTPVRPRKSSGNFPTLDGTAGDFPFGLDSVHQQVLMSAHHARHFLSSSVRCDCTRRVLARHSEYEALVAGVSSVASSVPVIRSRDFELARGSTEAVAKFIPCGWNSYPTFRGLGKTRWLDDNLFANFIYPVYKNLCKLPLPFSIKAYAEALH
jgi:hypothetical protein